MSKLSKFVFSLWEQVWSDCWYLRLFAFAVVWLYCGEDEEHCVLAALPLMCTIGNLHCTWCRAFSFVTYWLVCPRHGLLCASICAVWFPFAPKAKFPMFEVRQGSGRQKEGWCLRWRCRNADMLKAHADVFCSHGMAVDGNCHTLETRSMTTAECEALKAKMNEKVAEQEEFVDKYFAFWNEIKSYMSWSRPQIRVEDAAKTGKCQGTVHVTNGCVKKMLSRRFGNQTGKTYRTKGVVKSGLQRCVQKYTAQLSECFGFAEIGECLLRFFEEVDAKEKEWESAELAVGVLSLEASCRAVALYRAQGKLEPTHTLLCGFKIANVMQGIQKNNTYTGLVNFGSVTCWLNSVLQVLWHSDLLRQWVQYAETLPRRNLQRPFPVTQLKELNGWMGRYEVIAPFELLHFVLTTGRTLALLMRSVMRQNFWRWCMRCQMLQCQAQHSVFVSTMNLCYALTVSLMQRALCNRWWV